MESKPPPPPQLPVLPMNGPTLAANIAVAIYFPGNGAIQVQMADQRDAPVEHVGDSPRQAVFEIGRFLLTPRALRQLSDTTALATKAYEEATGKALPTMDQFNAAAAMLGLIPPQEPSSG